MSDGRFAVSSAAAFHVTAATTRVRLDGRTGEVAFTVSNALGQALHAKVRAIPLSGAQAEWFAVDTPVERTLPVNGTEQFVVRISVPPDTKKGAYALRLRVTAAENPEELVADGPVVSFEVPIAIQPPFPWWILLVIALVIAAVIIAILLWPKPHPPVGPIAGASAAASATPSPTPRAVRYLNAVKSDDPAVYYEMNGSSGASLPDASGHGLTGTIVGAVASVQSGGLPAPSDTAMQFDGTSGEIDSAYTQSGVTAYTVEAWVNTTDTAGLKAIVNDRGANGFSLTLGLNGSGGTGRPFFEMDNPFRVIVGVYATSVVVNDGRWHHVVGTWAAPSGTRLATSQFALYVDGQQVTTGPVQFGVNATNSPLTGDGPVRIARHNAFGTYFKGSLEEVAIYQTALSADRIHAHYQEAITP